MRRFLNMLIDFAGYLALSMFIGLALGIFAPGVLGYLENDSRLVNYAVGMVLLTLYYVPLELAFGRTLGKLVTGTRVVTEAAGGPPSFGQVLGRTLARFIPFEAFSCLRSNAVGWHDSLSGTRVVRVRRR